MHHVQPGTNSIKKFTCKWHYWTGSTYKFRLDFKWRNRISFYQWICHYKLFFIELRPDYNFCQRDRDWWFPFWSRWSGLAWATTSTPTSTSDWSWSTSESSLHPSEPLCWRVGPTACRFCTLLDHSQGKGSQTCLYCDSHQAVPSILEDPIHWRSQGWPAVWPRWRGSARWQAWWSDEPWSMFRQRRRERGSSFEIRKRRKTSDSERRPKTTDGEEGGIQTPSGPVTFFPRIWGWLI